MAFGMMKRVTACLLVAIFTLSLGCSRGERKAVPDELIGVWKTSATKYKNCAFELTRDYVVFVNEDVAGHVQMNSILRTEKIAHNGQILYTVHAQNIHGQKSVFAFFHDPSEDGAIRFKNQKQIVWRKVGKIRH